MALNFNEMKYMCFIQVDEDELVGTISPARAAARLVYSFGLSFVSAPPSNSKSLPRSEMLESNR